MSNTINEQGIVLIEHHDGFDWPGDLSFKTVNDFVHGPDRQYEELQYLCLGLAIELEKLNKNEYICKKCGLRKNSTHDIEHSF